MIHKAGIRRRVWFLLLAFVIFMSVLPGRFVPDWAHGKEIHFLAYAVLAAVALAGSRNARIAWLAVATALIMNVALEFVQLRIPGRAFELEDIFASTSGLVAGVLLGVILRRRQRYLP